MFQPLFSNHPKLHLMKIILFALCFLSTLFCSTAEEITTTHSGKTFTVDTSYIDNITPITPEMKTEIIAFMKELKEKNVDPITWLDKIQEKIGDPNSEKFYCRLFWKIKSPSGVANMNDLFPEEFLFQTKGIRANRFKILVTCYANGSLTTVQVVYNEGDKVICVAQSVTKLSNFAEEMNLKFGQAHKGTMKMVGTSTDEFKRISTHPELVKFLSTFITPHTQIECSYFKGPDAESKLNP